MEKNRDHIVGKRMVNDMMIGAALGYSSLGHRPIPLISGTKRSRVKWKEFVSRVPAENEIRSWFSGAACDIAFLTGNGMCVVDIDDRTLVHDVLKQCGDTPMRCLTPNGMHLYYAWPERGLCGNRVRINGLPIDLRGDGAYAVVPWSRDAKGVAYEWVGDVLATSALPPMKTDWLRKSEPKRFVTPAVMLGDSSIRVRRARAYLAHIEGAVSGRRGHDRTFRVACVLMIKFGLSIEEAWPPFLEWNDQCEPPWSEKELLHKLQDAHKQRFRF